MYIYTYSLCLGPPALTPSSPPSPWSSQSTEQALPVLYSNSPLAILYTVIYGSVYILHSQFVPPSPSLSVSMCSFFTSASLFLPWKYGQLYRLKVCHTSQKENKYHILIHIYMESRKMVQISEAFNFSLTHWPQKTSLSETHLTTPGVDFTLAEP